METEPFRLAEGGRIDRTRLLRFTFNRQPFWGYDGDTLASALMAQGIRLTGRSFKYHRPRGIVGVGVEEPASMVELVGEAASGSQPITTVRITEGLEARSVNCWPSPALDVGAMAQSIARLLPAGFYYKTFMWPGWRVFEPMIRRAAGLARAPATPPARGRYEARNAHADVLVAGAGPAGLMAALTAARTGARVFLADEQAEPGGNLLATRKTIDGRPALDWVADVVAELATMKNVIHLQDATVWGYREHNLVMVAERSPPEPALIERSWRVRAARVIVATGAIERLLTFANNDLPGVMLASAAQTYVNRYAVRPGERAVVFANNDSAYAAAVDLAGAGIDVRAIVDHRAFVPDHARALAGQIEILHGHVVAKAHGHRRLRAVSVEPAAGGAPRRITADLLTFSGGWNPAVHLYSQSRGTLRYDEALATFVPDQPAQPALAAGAAAGTFGLGRALAEGARAGAAAAEAPPPTTIPNAEDTPYTIQPLWHVAARPGANAFLDLQNDVTVDDVHLALREGYDSIEHVKRYTTGGMGLDQGKTGNLNIIGVVAEAQGRPLSEIGTTTFRAPYTPVSFGAIAGGREGPVILPYRHTPVTRWNIERGAFFYEAGARWRRPGYFPRGAESFQETVNRECQAVREGVGVYDGSPLGKFEIKGPDAARFLDLLYTNTFSSLAVGRARYGLMLSEDGLILDDGVSLRLGPDRFLMSTSTGHADSVNQHMEKLLQIERPDWQVMITTVTSQWCNATICGPRARAVMAALGTDIDLSAEALPFMAFADGQVADLPARVVRVSFTGEISFEINVWPRHMATLWERIIAAGAPFGIEPVGSEANHVLRVEKGFLSLGHEVDGTADPFDLGMGWIVSKTKADFIGKRAVEIRRADATARRELVGILPKDPNRQIPEGAPMTPGGRREPTEGFVSACVWSVVNDRWVGLGLLRNGRARIGQEAHIRLTDGTIPVEITRPCFHDPDGLRLRG